MVVSAKEQFSFQNMNSCSGNDLKSYSYERFSGCNLRENVWRWEVLATWLAAKGLKWLVLVVQLCKIRCRLK